MKLQIAGRSVNLLRHRISLSLEDDFWVALKEIEDEHKSSCSLVEQINGWRELGIQSRR
ncbi:ribbon-helix-helix domain-containing protein [Rhodopseudomonas pseudopalustris]|uniref:ribbon-helix-helix domain-containing protein n=1 Tax=Rhodopseudomonas pseudopalustris TaxID=1513892 RepID=UPI001113B6EA